MSAVDQVYADIDRELAQMQAAEIERERPWSIVLDLPLPPSVNSFTKKLGNRSPVVRSWRKQADMHFLMQTLRRRPQPLLGAFETYITWDTSSRMDWDNPCKALMDYLEYLKLIENDRMCRRGVIDFGKTSQGCRVRLRAWGGA